MSVCRNALNYLEFCQVLTIAVTAALSHTAILAREHDVPMIVGADGLSNIANGSLLRLHLDGRVEVLEQQKRQVFGMTAAE